MSYKDFQKNQWNSLASTFGDANPFKAVISKDSDITNYYFNKATERIVHRLFHLRRKMVLDLGCGVGRLTNTIARNADHVVGVDISEEMIRVATKKAASQNLSNVAFRVYDGTILPFDDNSFNAIVCLGVLKYVIEDNDFSTLISEMCRTSTRDGQIGIIDQFDYEGPVALCGSQDLGAMSVLRQPMDYISRFKDHGFELAAQHAIVRKRLQNLVANKLAKWTVGRFIISRPIVMRTVATLDLWLDEMLKHNVKAVRGFQFLLFQRR